MGNWKMWVPGGLLSVGCLFTLFIDRQQVVELAAPLSTLPIVVADYRGIDLPISEAEQRVAGMTNYSFRAFVKDSAEVFSIYVGYYDHQTQGKTIHSPKNCLPGSGWEALAQTERQVSTPTKQETVNRYLLQNGNERALVFYWYQGRGRVAANEYRVKWELLRDAAVKGRSEEALVRIVIRLSPTMNEQQAEQLASRIAGELIPSVYEVLPA
jgi:EpsI family protein